MTLKSQGRDRTQLRLNTSTTVQTAAMGLTQHSTERVLVYNETRIHNP